MGIFKPINTIRGRDASGSDNVLTDSLSAGLEAPASLPTLMIVGALLNPLHQNGARMVAATLCTQSQLEDGMRRLTEFVKEFYEKDERNDVDLNFELNSDGGGGKGNKYDVPTNPDRTFRDSPRVKAEKEIRQFFANNNARFLPKMKAHRMLGVVDERSQPKEPVYELGPVLERGDDFYVCGNTRLNHADYIDQKGHFHILQFYEGTKHLYPGLAYLCLGKLGHHSCQEADCDTLFSMSGYKSDARRLNALIQTYERLVIAIHRMHRFHICDQVIIKEYLRRVRNNDWDNNESRDDKEFLKLEEEMWSAMYPGLASALAAQDEFGDEVTSDSADKGDKLCQFFDGHDNSEVMNLPVPRVPYPESI